jgi:SAM-dependent methyltransferase
VNFKYNIAIPLDSPERTMFHREIIRKKPFLRRLYTEWYSLFSKEIRCHPPGTYIELGSGGGFLKEIEPGVICSDILPLPKNDMTFSALKMPFDDESVSGIFMIDTFHHIPDAQQFLSEANRVLKRQGKLIMIEPANSIWGRFIYKNFHHEPFNTAGNWQIPDTGPLSGANGALPWIVFTRDRQKFNEEFTSLQIESMKYHTPLRYLISGGVSYRQLMPGFTYAFFMFLDRILAFISPQLSMFVTICIRKK